MTLAERLASAQADLGHLYLQRERVQLQLQQTQHEAQRLQIEMSEKDGEIRAYTALIAAGQGAA